MINIIGISAFYHDSSACLLRNGKIYGAVQEERFTRIKHDASFPTNSIKFLLNKNNLNLSEIDYFIFYEKPFLKFERLLETYLSFAPKGFFSFCKSMPLWIKEKLFQKDLIFNSLKKIDNKFKDSKKIKFSEHHLSHAASAFYPSPFEESIILTLDGVGEWATTTIAIGKHNKIQIEKEIHFPHSLGLLYSAFTYYLGFKVNSGEYKIMGLAPYGIPKYKDLILNNLITIKDDGSFIMDMSYFNYATGLTMVNKKFEKLFQKKKRSNENESLEQFHMDIAASIQSVTEDVVLKICKHIKSEYKIDNLCLSGGVALNCVANGKIIQENIFSNLWVQPASGDAGGSLGAALAFWHNFLNNEREVSSDDAMQGSYLGPSFSEEEIERELIRLKAVYKKYYTNELIEIIADLIANQNIIGWFQGRAEYGPRSLGNRSILADPRSKDMQKNLNLKIKFRESFRPFAPSVLKEKAQEYFNLKQNSPYMLLVASIKDNLKIPMSEKERSLFGIQKLNIKRSSIPAVTHVDYSARVQTVCKKTNLIFYNLIEQFEKITKCPILVNTSFNIRGEPIVNSPSDAFNCFMGTDLDILVCGNFVMLKKEQNKEFFKNYKHKFQLD